MNREDIVELKGLSVELIESPSENFLNSVWDKVFYL